MKKMSIIASSEEVMRNLAHFLELRNYKNIQVNRNAGEIIAERKKFVFGRKDKVSLKVIPVNETITNVELILNPGIHERPEVIDQLEETLRDRIYNFL